MPCNAEFGIVDHVEPGKAYDASYEPEKYGCVSISDDYLNDWWDRLSVLPSYFHNLNRPEKGLARFGVTLIPPESAREFAEIAASDPRLGTSAELRALLEVLRDAARRGKFVIHYGV